MQQRSLCVIVTIRSSLCLTPSLCSSSKSSRWCLCVNANWPKTKVIKKSTMKIYWCGVDGSSHRSPCIVPSTQDMCIHIHSHVEYTPFHAKVYRLSSSRRAEYKPYVNRVFVVSNYLFTCVCVCSEDGNGLCAPHRYCLTLCRSAVLRLSLIQWTHIATEICAAM